MSTAHRNAVGFPNQKKKTKIICSVSLENDFKPQIISSNWKIQWSSQWKPLIQSLNFRLSFFLQRYRLETFPNSTVFNCLKRGGLTGVRLKSDWSPTGWISSAKNPASPESSSNWSPVPAHAQPYWFYESKNNLSFFTLFLFFWYSLCNRFELFTIAFLYDPPHLSFNIHTHRK